MRLALDSGYGIDNDDDDDDDDSGNTLPTKKRVRSLAGKEDDKLSWQQNDGILRNFLIST